MNKQTFIAIIILLLGLNLFQLYSNHNKSKNLANTEGELEVILQENETLVAKNKTAKNLAKQKKLEVEILEGEVEKKEAEINNLEIEKRNSSIQIKELQASLDDIQQQLENSNGNIDEQQRLQLLKESYEAKEAQYLAQIGTLDSIIVNVRKENEIFQEELATLKQQLLDNQILTDSLTFTLAATDSLFTVFKDDQAIIQTIVEQTTIDVNKVKLKGKENSIIDFRRLGRRQRENWKRTEVEFMLSHPDVMFIQDKSFAMKLVDKDADKPMAYREGSSRGDNEGKVAVPFFYSEDSQKATHINFNDPRNADNYDIQFFLVYKEKEYLLFDGIVPVIENGKRSK